MYMFYSRKHEKHRVPKSLVPEPSSAGPGRGGAPASSTGVQETAARREVVLAFSAPSYKDRFSALVSSLPVVFGVVKDPVESSVDLEEVRSNLCISTTHYAHNT
jgi:hypothetical protein